MSAAIAIGNSRNRNKTPTKLLNKPGTISRLSLSETLCYVAAASMTISTLLGLLGLNTE